MNWGGNLFSFFLLLRLAVNYEKEFLLLLLASSNVDVNAFLYFFVRVKNGGVIISSDLRVCLTLLHNNARWIESPRTQYIMDINYVSIHSHGVI